MRLFDRSTHHLRLTDADESFRSRAAAALYAAEAAFDPDRVGPWPLRLGHAWSAFGHHTATVLHRWQQLHPQMPLQLLRTDDSLARAGPTRSWCEAMSVTGIRNNMLFHEQRMAALSSHNDLAKRSELAVDDLAGQTLIMNTVSGPPRSDYGPPSTSRVASQRSATSATGSPPLPPTRASASPPQRPQTSTPTPA
ncbi:hypothetical protein ACFVZH_33455 [Streptomyces sp. NPDC059534]|uniref:hypothetical protein n=1 Tax=Streptomyces sp. NPDC059534 TaxID=3346859 RepID=UPI0036B402F2